MRPSPSNHSVLVQWLSIGNTSSNLSIASLALLMLRSRAKVSLDITLVGYLSRRLSTFSTTGWQSVLGIFFHLNGKPKYRMGRPLLGVPKVSKHYNSSSYASLNPRKADLVRLICRPEKSANRSYEINIFLASSVEPSIKDIVSSTYCNKGMLSGQLGVWYPFKKPCEHACIVHVGSVSAARTNDRGASGHPCLTPPPPPLCG